MNQVTQTKRGGMPDRHRTKTEVHDVQIILKAQIKHNSRNRAMKRALSMASLFCEEHDAWKQDTNGDHTESTVYTADGEIHIEARYVGVTGDIMDIKERRKNIMLKSRKGGFRPFGSESV